ncbi:MAG: histidine phosphatase family protein [Phascolarctobacterium sp.]|nr:histidine phosphatase family protein [Phascolarctobacterium sp.]
MIILVRHGEAAHHVEGLTGGWTDSELTTLGKKQIKAAADRLAGDFASSNFSLRILSSDLKRAAESAEIIAKTLGFDGQIEEYLFLREKNNGRAAGLKEETAKKLYCRTASFSDINHRNYPDGETRSEFYERNVHGLMQYADLENENLIIVAHKGTIQNIIFYWLGMDMQQVVKQRISVDIQPAGITVLGINKWNEHAIFLLNDTAHLTKNRKFGIWDFKYGKKEG